MGKNDPVAEEAIITFRVSPDFKKQLQKAAREDKRSVSRLIKEQLEAYLQTRQERRRDVSEAVKALKRLSGCVSFGGSVTSEEIDRVVYGDDFGDD